MVTIPGHAPTKGSSCSGPADRRIRKSASMGNLSQYSASRSGLNPGSCCGGGSSVNCPDSSRDMTADHVADGYASVDGVPGSASRERKKDVPWTEEERRMFLLGSQNLGKGDWR